jgi:hypothetical protein
LKSVSTSDEISEPNSLMQKMIWELHEQTLTLYCMSKVNIESKTNYFSGSKVIAWLQKLLQHSWHQWLAVFKITAKQSLAFPKLSYYVIRAKPLMWKAIGVVLLIHAYFRSQTCINVSQIVNNFNFQSKRSKNDS